MLVSAKLKAGSLLGLNEEQRSLATPTTRLVVWQDALVRQVFVRFLRVMVGRPLYFLFNPALQNQLEVTELLFIWLLIQRLAAAHGAVLSAANPQLRYPWRYGGVAFYIAVMLRDPQMICDWLQHRLRYLSLFQHRRFFRIFVLALRLAVLRPKYRYSLKGLYFYLVGKISVTGNAMSRSYLVRVGQTSNANMNLRQAQSFMLVRTTTGCLGCTLGFYY